MIHLSYLHLFFALWALSLVFAIPEYYNAIRTHMHHQSRKHHHNHK